ncbi:glycosyltransferase 87 family protein [Micromonospora sp. WMMD1120]|uniref:glycosyltransferase 87 family protein n=1 Tax=Micromonospora sp. WMMD1120 TaxID=3016106 RepID=UPI00241768B8|nr:glycosyltransferase 87 family protein [Micromonospora sp. WMMD1120]MDG4805354.1 glycosyltransferase 87 family protein [Micromonospora sp. WMMD1120]
MRDRRVALAWATFVVVALVSAVLVLRRPDRLSDLHIYYGALADLRAGRPLYGYVAENGGPFTYPPFAALVLWPITAVSEGILQLIWLVATCAAVVAIAGSVGAALTTRQSRRPLVVALTATVLLLSAPVQSNLRFGQVSIFIVLLALVDGIGLVPPRLRGTLVGVAAAIKLTPLLFVVYFLAVRRYRDAGRAAVTFLACAGLGAVVLPTESWTYWTEAVRQTSRIGNLASLGNQSVHGMLLRVGVDESTLPLLWAGLVALICAVALLRARQLTRHGRPGHAVVLVGCATVAASPVSWTHHQVWPVLAAMLLIGASGVAQRVGGAALLAAMVVSLGAVLSPISTRPGVQFLFENARAVGVGLLCLVGFGGVAVAARRTSRRPTAGRAWLRVGVTATVAVAFFAVQPLPAGADPTFKAYTIDDVVNPRYFFVCRGPAECARYATDAPVTFGTRAEKTKVRVNGVVSAAVTRLEYYSAPGGAPRSIPLLAAYPGTRTFSFRAATMAQGRLVAYAADGRPIASYDDELAAALRTTSR